LIDPILRISIVDHKILTLNPPELVQPLPERVEQGRPIGRGRHPKPTYPGHLSRLLRVGAERRGEDTHGEESDECAPPDHQAATTVCWFNTAPIFCQPSILRNLICPLATRLKSRTGAASSVGSEPCVCALEKRKNVRSSSPPSRRLVTTPGQRLFHVRSKAA
jgi:hypothetical protein